jgi:hypothetical protein
MSCLRVEPSSTVILFGSAPVTCRAGRPDEPQGSVAAIIAALGIGLQPHHDGIASGAEEGEYVTVGCARSILRIAKPSLYRQLAWGGHLGLFGCVHAIGCYLTCGFRKLAPVTRNFYVIDLAGLLVLNGLARIYGTRTPLPDGRDSRTYLVTLAGLEQQAKSAGLGGWRYYGFSP